MKNFLFSILTLLLFSEADMVAQAIVHRFVVQPISQINIKGSTSVNDYKCCNEEYKGGDTLILMQKNKSQPPVFTRGAVYINVSCIDCGMNVMTKDFGETIKASKYPIITIKFISFAKLPKYTAEEERFNCTLSISLAGETKEFEVNCTITKAKNGLIHLKGCHDFTFGDFKLKAPQKMMGMIKVKDELQVDFHLVLLRV